MQTLAKNSRFIKNFPSRVESSSLDTGATGGISSGRSLILGLLQSNRSNHGLRALASGLIDALEDAYSRRDIATLARLSSLLIELPLESARPIGLYFQALALKRTGLPERALPLLEIVADGPNHAYRARAIQAIGATHYDLGRLDESLRFHLEAVRAAAPERSFCDLLGSLMAQADIGILMSRAGDHGRALAHFQNLWPMFRAVAYRYPAYLYTYQNALAVELGEIGLIDEAKAACAFALSYPFADAYPEWHETRAELAAKQRELSGSSVALGVIAPASRRSSEHLTNRAPRIGRAILLVARLVRFLTSRLEAYLGLRAHSGELVRKTLPFLCGAATTRGPPSCANPTSRF